MLIPLCGRHRASIAIAVFFIIIAFFGLQLSRTSNAITHQGQTGRPHTIEALHQGDGLNSTATTVSSSKAATSPTTTSTAFSAASSIPSSSATSTVSVLSTTALSTSDPATISVELPTSVHEALPLPSDYLKNIQDPPFCADRFGLKYLENLRDSAFQYDDGSSTSGLTCFRSQTASDGRVDSFCVGGPAIYNSSEKTFGLNCQIREWKNVKQGIPRIASFPSYWYETGPLVIFDRHIRTGLHNNTQGPVTEASIDWSILIQREEKVTNPWHTLMEIFSLFMTLDVLQMTRNPQTNESYFKPENMQDTRVIILDSHPEGPFYDLWSHFAHRPMIRLNDTSADALKGLQNVIVPLPGGSNPFWQGDWETHSCAKSELLRIFAKRVLEFYGIKDDEKIKDTQGVDNAQGTKDRPLTLTFIDRKEKRKLFNKEKYLEKLRLRFPTIQIQLVDFANISFVEQLRIVRRTDVLAGVHGAGLTHGMFLPSQSALVEILPVSLKHKGFRNMARLLGLRFFSSHANEHEYSVKDDWQTEDVAMEEDRFMDLMEVAIKSVYNRGLHNDDIT